MVDRQIEKGCEICVLVDALLFGERRYNVSDNRRKRVSFAEIHRRRIDCRFGIFGTFTPAAHIISDSTGKGLADRMAGGTFFFIVFVQNGDLTHRHIPVGGDEIRRCHGFQNAHHNSDRRRVLQREGFVAGDFYTLEIGI